LDVERFEDLRLDMRILKQLDAEPTLAHEYASDIIFYSFF